MPAPALGTIFPDFCFPARDGIFCIIPLATALASDMEDVDGYLFIISGRADRVRHGANEGAIELVGDDDNKGGAKPAKRKVAPVRPREGNMGHTLRNVYQQTVNEDIPAEMLDLLGKLA